MEDAHYCIKCGLILVGLDNYINHRKLPCERVTSSKIPFEEAVSGDTKTETDAGAKSESKNPELDKTSENVEADDFFSSLELQSSSKTTNHAANVGIPNKAPTGIVTRSKTSLTSYQDVKLSSKSSTDIVTRSKTLETERTEIKNKGKAVRRTKVKKRRLLKPKKKTARTSEARRVVLNKERRENQQKRQSIADEGSGMNPASDKNKEDDEWNLFNQLGMKKDEKETLGSIRRYTPELFSMSPMLELPENKHVEVDKFLDHGDYDDNDAYLNLEDAAEYSYAPPRSHTGGKWKPGSMPVRKSPMLWPGQPWDSPTDEEGRNSSIESPTESDKSKTFSIAPTKWKSYNPPSNYTGGKWKPSETPQTVKKLQDVPPATYTGGKWHPGKRIPSEPPATHTGGKWHPGKRIPSEPPATHTGGKWKPQIVQNHQIKPWKTDVSSDSKWVSSDSKNSMDNKTLSVIASCQSTSGKCLKTAGGLIQYYCSPCNRRLASKKMYKKHIMSELHLKRVLQENELEFDSRSIRLVRGLFSVMKNKERGLGKREIKKPQFFKNMEMGNVKRGTKDSDKVKRKRLPKKELIRCDICKTKLATHQLGKHLVSYYHSRRIRLNEPEQQKLVLDNIHAIVKQAPFQCGICKFYFNSHSLFKKHWTSEGHKSMEETDGKKFWCVLCNFESETSRSMELHLDSNSHREVIMAVNKSIPIIIRQKQILNCKFCDKEFRYNFALTRHNLISHGFSETETAKVYPCNQCKYKSHTVKSLQRHVLCSHKDAAEVPYFCSACELYFRNAEDAKNHRKSQAHRSRKKDPDAPRAYSYCPTVTKGTGKSTAHMEEDHPGLRPKCSICGKTFGLPQELAQHAKTCSFLQARTGEPEVYRCRFCAYSSSLKADILYHEVLHENSRSQKILCPICRKVFRTFTLKVHLRSHTGERPYECRTCSKKFIRKSRFAAHLKLYHGVGGKSERKEVAAEGEDAGIGKSKAKEVRQDAGPKCGDPKCRYVPKDANDLEYHCRVHVARNLFQCPLCNYQTKNSTVLRRHNKIHFNERPHPCPHCPFRGRLAAHLKRHMRLHTGAKPYKCPHCPYRCNNLENLRKHVLQTKIHPGKMLYDCKMCKYSTNVFKDFKEHLYDKHGDSLATEGAAAAYVSGIYKVEEDLQTTLDPVPVKPKTVPTPPNNDRAVALKTAAILAKKYKAIAPKPEPESPPEKAQGNAVQDEGKVLEIELEKLSSRAEEPPLQFYPAPATLIVEREEEIRNDSEEQWKTASECANEKENGMEQMEEETEDLTGHIIYDYEIPFEDNEYQLVENQFYL